jgi:hypothetical protein
MTRLVGNDKVPAEERLRLRVLKAMRQGLGLHPAKSWWPELIGLPPPVRSAVKDAVRDTFVWQATAPKFSTDGRRIS